MSLLNEPLMFTEVVRAARVTLVGAGPGDPELLTLKAAKALRAASLVLYDHLVGKEVLELVPRNADRIYVGKEAGCHTLTQDGIIDLMIRLARAGKPVLRLKGGDPFIFGRGGRARHPARPAQHRRQRADLADAGAGARRPGAGTDHDRRRGQPA